jgi:hypothetical protein
MVATFLLFYSTANTHLPDMSNRLRQDKSLAGSPLLRLSSWASFGPSIRKDSTVYISSIRTQPVP